MTHRLYVVVDGSLAPGLQIAQAIHAKDEFTRAYPDVEREWARTSNTISVLAIGNEAALDALADRCAVMDVRCARFTEVDLDNRLTAIAIEPGYTSERLVRGLKPALS